MAHGRRPGTRLSLVRPEPLPQRRRPRTNGARPSLRPLHGSPRPRPDAAEDPQIFRLAESRVPVATVRPDRRHGRTTRTTGTCTSSASGGRRQIQWIIQAGAPGAREAEPRSRSTGASPSDDGRDLPAPALVQPLRLGRVGDRLGRGRARRSPLGRPVWFATVPARRFRIDDQDQLRLLTQEEPVDDVALAPGKWWITVSARAASSPASRCPVPAPGCRSSSATRPATGTSTRRSSACRSPWRSTTTTAALTDVEDRREEDRRGHPAGTAAPSSRKSIEARFESADRNGDATGTHGGLISFCNRRLSKLINGSTLSNDNGDSGRGELRARRRPRRGPLGAGPAHDAERLRRASGSTSRVPFLPVQRHGRRRAAGASRPGRPRPDAAAAMTSPRS